MKNVSFMEKNNRLFGQPNTQEVCDSRGKRKKTLSFKFYLAFMRAPNMVPNDPTSWYSQAYTLLHCTSMGPSTTQYSRVRVWHFKYRLYEILRLPSWKLSLFCSSLALSGVSHQMPYTETCVVGNWRLLPTAMWMRLKRNLWPKSSLDVAAPSNTLTAISWENWARMTQLGCSWRLDP